MQLPAASVLVISAGHIQTPDSMPWQVKDFTVNLKMHFYMLVIKQSETNCN